MDTLGEMLDNIEMDIDCVYGSYVGENTRIKKNKLIGNDIDELIFDYDKLDAYNRKAILISVIQHYVNEYDEGIRNNGYHDLYIAELENALMTALDTLVAENDRYDYYDTLRELTGWGNYQALEFLEKFGDNEDDE